MAVRADAPGPTWSTPKNLDKGRSITLTRNDDWWARDKKFYKNRYNFDRIHFTVIRDKPKAFEAFKKGELDTMRVREAEYWYDKLPDSDPLVANGYIGKYTAYNDTARGSWALWINEAQPILDHQDVRVGINYATNWDLVIEKYFRGDYERMRTTYDGFGEFTHPTLKARPFSVEKALESFAKAGFKQRGADGILVNDKGQRLSFTLSTGYENFRDILTILREEALKAGLEFRLEVLDQTAAFKKSQEKQHDIVFTGFNVSPEMYPRYWEYFHSTNAYDRPFLEDGSVNPDAQDQGPDQQPLLARQPRARPAHRPLRRVGGRRGDAEARPPHRRDRLRRGLLRPRLRDAVLSLGGLALHPLPRAVRPQAGERVRGVLGALDGRGPEEGGPRGEEGWPRSQPMVLDDETYRVR